MKQIWGLLVIILLFQGCATGTSKPIDPYVLINNSQAYDDVVNKTYETSDIKKIYRSSLSEIARSDYDDIMYLAENIDLKIIRGNEDNGYYTLYKMEDSTLFVFFGKYDNDFAVSAMYILPHKPIVNTQELIDSGAKTYQDLINLYPSIKLASQEIILQDFTMALVFYENDSSKIKEIREWNYLYPQSQEYLKCILPMDLPEEYQ